ncbi:MAG: tetratricopeptide repeat protein [Deltaproteobacteria bacterium]|nr:tetratricopeptide repeat protein [Deltaproteobacteria bacterium]
MTRRYHISILALAAIFLVLTGCASVDKKKASPIHIKGDEMKAAGVDAYGIGDYAGARSAFAEALRLDRSVDNREGELLDLINLARVAVVTGGYIEARAWLADAVPLAQLLKDDKNLSEAYATLAKADYLTGNHDAAWTHIEAALAIDQRLGVKSGGRLNLKAAILVASGKTAAAKSVLVDALRLNAGALDAPETANSYRALAEADIREGSDAPALDYYQRAYETSREAGDNSRLAADLVSISALQMKIGRTEDALFSLNRLYAVASASGTAREAAFALDGLISINEAAGNMDKGVFYRKLRDALSGMGAR